MKNFREFSDEWIEENVNDELYTHMKDDVRAFVALYLRQHHSGTSTVVFMDYIWRLMIACLNQKVSE